MPATAKIPPNAIDALFRAFADRTRLRILNLLRTQELCVCDLVAILQIPQPKASRHLAYLRRAGLVLARKQGLWAYYRLAPSRGKFHERLLTCLSDCFTEVPQLREDQSKLKSNPCGPTCPPGCC